MDTAKIEEWYRLNVALKDLKQQELALRKEVFGEFFPEPKEGTNTVHLRDGWVLKGTHKLTRKIQEALIADVAEETGMTTVIKNCIVYKPSLNKTEYSKLSDRQRKMFDNCLEIKPATPSMDVVLPKKAQNSKK